MQIGIRVEYQTGAFESGNGIVTSFNDETDIVTVKDENDGTVWRGPADLATALKEHGKYIMQHIGDLNVEGEREIRGQVTGTTYVRTGGKLVTHAQHSGGLIIEQGGVAILHGQSSRNVVNHGTLELHGQVSGQVIGYPPVNALRSDQIGGVDLPVPFIGNSSSWSCTVEANIQRSIEAWNTLTDAERAAALKAAKTAVPACAMRHMGWDIPESLSPELDGNLPA